MNLRDITVYIFVGLPASGKSTKASEMFKENKDNLLIFNLDKIREMLTGDNYNLYPFNTRYSNSLEKSMMYDFLSDFVKYCLEKYKDMIIDEVNITIYRREKILKMINDWLKIINRNVTVNFVYFKADAETCKERCKNNRKGVDYKQWCKVIDNMQEYLDFKEDIYLIDKYRNIKEIKFTTL